MAWLRPRLRQPRWRIGGAIGAALVVGLLGGLGWLLATRGGEDRPGIPDPPGFALSPAGDDVPRLAPIKVTFASPPDEKAAAKLILVQPRPKGTYAWLSDRTLLFQPEFPGLLRGSTYTVKVPARPETGLNDEISRQFTVTGLLTIQQAIPGDGDSEVPLNAPIMVQFSRSVAPLTTLSAQNKAPVVSFDPPLEGTGEWLNTSIYRFTPKSLAPFTKYKMRIAKGLTSAADGVLKEDFAWSFTTISPAVDSVVPDNNTEFAGPRQPVTVHFNQPMDRGSVASGFSVKLRDGAAVAGSLAWSNNDASVTFTPSGQLAFDSTYDVTVAKGLKGAKGGVTANERNAGFKTVGIPAVRNTNPPNGSPSAGRFGVFISFTNPMDPDSYEGKMSISGFAAKDLEGRVNGDERTVYANVSLRPSTAYTVTLAPGVKDRYGQVMGGYTLSFTTAPLEPSISLALPGYSSAGTYSATAEPILFFHATNVTSAPFTLYPLTPAEMKCLGGSFDGGGCDFKDFAPSLPAQRTWTVPISAAKDEVTIASTSLSGGGLLPKGYYFVRTGSTSFANSMVFAVVDTVIATKLSNDELVTWVLDHDTGKPLSGVKVVAEGGGLPLTTATTDANGLASFKVPEPVIGKNINRNYYVTLDDGGHRGVTTTNWRQGSFGFDRSIPTEYFVRGFVGQIYTDRPIYRPGETVEYKGVVRADDDARYTVPAIDSGNVFILLDATRKEVKREAIRTNEFGTFAGSFELPGDAPIGDYSISIQDKDSKNQGYGYYIAGNSFLVAEFRKPEYQVSVEPGKKSYVDGDAIDVRTSATYFFGGGVENASVEWSALGVPTSLFVKGYERYSFRDYDYWQEPVFKQPVRASGVAKTGADGVASYTIPAKLAAGEGAQLFTLTAAVTDLSAQSVASSAAVTVHAGELYAGVRPAQYVAITGKETAINVVTADTDGKVLANRSAVVKVYNREWVTTKIQTPDGGRNYKSEPRDTLIATLDVKTNDKGEGSATFAPTKPGTLRIVSEGTDSKGRVTKSAAYLWVAGQEFASWRITNDDTITLVADKEKYEVGETAEILVPAPFAGATGLVTVERGKVITRAVQQFPTNSERIQIPITDRSVPNVFVSVMLYRAPTAADPIPRYKLGYVQLPVSTATRVLNVTIRPDREQAKPGETVRYDIKVTDSTGKGVKAEVSAAVVDKAIFALEDERGPNGLQAFWFQRGLSVTNASSMAVSVNRSNDVIAEPQGGGKGGGLDSDQLRTEFRNTAFWQAQLVTKEDGTATVDVKMPDNLTTWRMAVRAVSGNTQVGEGSNELISTQPMLIRPALPRFLRVGDTFDVRMLVRNATSAQIEARVTLDAEGITLAKGDAQTLKIPANQSVVAIWPARVEAEGRAKLTFTATGPGGLKDGIVQELPIYLDVTPETMATGGILTGEPVYEALYLPPFAITKQGSLTVSVQAALTGSMADELGALSPQPWEGAERVSSRLIATIGVRRAQKSAGQSTAALDSAITRDLASLIGRQRSDGGWPWCDHPLCQTDPTVTAWALLAIGEARRDNLSVDNGVVTRATAYLFTYVNRTTDVNNPADPNQKAFMLAALASAGAGNSTLPPSRALFEQHRAKLTNWGKAYLLLSMNDAGVKTDDPQVRALLNDLAATAIPSANGNHWEDDRVPGSFMRNTGTTALIALALARIQPEQPLVANTVRWLVIARGAEGWHTNIDRAHAVLALTTYAVQTGELGADFSYSVTVANKEILAGLVKPGEATKTNSNKLPLSGFKAGETSLLTFVREFARPGRLYYTLNFRYFTPAKEVEAVNRGFAVSHEYTKLDDPTQKITSAKLGETVRVKLTVLIPADRNYVVIDDLLPAGLEPVDTRLKTIDPKLKAELELERVAASTSKRGGYHAPWFRWYYNPFQQVDVRDDRTTLYADRISKGVYEYIYYARATTPGDFFVAPAHAEETYFPETFGRSDSGRFTVTP